jgi:hypothetical protein
MRDEKRVAHRSAISGRPGTPWEGLGCRCSATPVAVFGVPSLAAKNLNKKRRRHDGVACSTIRVDMHLFIGSRRFDGLILGAPPLFSHCTLV